MTMQTQADKQFDKFIQGEMNDFILESSFDEQWTKMDRALDNRKFMRFTPLNFNIYYLSLLIMGVLVAILFYLNTENINTQDKNKEQKGNIPVIKEANIIVQNKDSSYQPENIKTQFKNKKANLNKESSNLNNEVLNTEIMPASSLNKESKDTFIQSKLNENKEKISVKPDSIAKPLIIKKIKYVTKRDTIIKMDSNKITRKR
jgi:hypothetical protein